VYAGITALMDAYRRDYAGATLNGAVAAAAITASVKSALCASALRKEQEELKNFLAGE